MAGAVARVLAWSVGLTVASTALAAGDADSGTDIDALRLADTATAAPVSASDWRGSFEAALANYTRASQTGPVTLNNNARVSNTFAYDGTFGGWRAILSNRFDAGWRAGRSRYDAFDTLRKH